MLVAETDAVAPHGLRDGDHGVILSDDPVVELGLEPRQPGTVRLADARHRDAGRPRDDPRDLRLPHDRFRARAAAQRIQFALDRLDLVAQARRILVVLGSDRGVLLGLQLGEPCQQVAGVDALPERQAQARPRLVDQVDRFVRQEPVGDVAGRQLDGGADRLVGVLHTVVLLVRAAQSGQDEDGVLDARLADGHRLEASLERRVLLDPAVLLESGGAHQVQVAAGETGLQDVASIHPPGFAGAAGPDDGVQLVDEDDQLVRAGADLIHQRGEALLEVATVAGARHHAGEVEGDHPLVLQLLGHVAGRDGAGEALDDRGLPDAGLPDQHRVVLGAPRKDLHGLLDLVEPADDGVEPAVPCERGEVGAERVEHRRSGALLPLCGCGGRCADGRRLPHGGGQGVGRHAGGLQHLPGGGVLRDHECEEDVLGVDVGRAGGAGDLVRVEQRALGGRRDGGGVGVERRSGLRKPLLGGVGDGLRVYSDPAHRIGGRLLERHDAQDVQGVELAVAVFECEPSGLGEELLRAPAEEPADVDRARGARTLTREITGEELVERVRAVTVGSEILGHVIS